MTLKRLLIGLLLVAAWVLVPAPHSSAAERQAGEVETTFGIQANLVTKDAGIVMNGISAMRLQWVALDVSWASVNPDPGVYDWAVLDASVNVTRPFGMRVLLRVGDAPDWAGAPVDADAFATFVGLMADRYSGRVAAYELWPRANTGAVWPDGESVGANAYLALLQGASAEVRRADPNARVISGGLVPAPEDTPAVKNDLRYLEALLDGGLVGLVDGVGLQLDGQANPPEAYDAAPDMSYQYFRHYEAVRELVQAFDAGETPLWITGLSWASSEHQLSGAPAAHEVTEDQQAEYLVAALDQVTGSGYIEVLIIDNFNAAVIPGVSPVAAARSLLRENWSARPAFIALAQARQAGPVANVVTPTPNIPQAVRVVPNWSPRMRQY